VLERAAATGGVLLHTLVEEPLRRMLVEVERGRVVGLTVEAEPLLAFRRRRRQHLGGQGLAAYADPREVVEDLEHALAVFRRGRFATIDVTAKPIEESASEVVAVVARQSGLEIRSRTSF